MRYHRNAALTFEARRRLIQRCQTRPIAHVAAEAGVSRACLSKWVNRYRRFGEAGLVDGSSRPHTSPTMTSAEVVELIERWRRDHKWSASRISHELMANGHHVSVSTVTRWLQKLGLNRRRFLDVDGTPTRTPGRITARFPGHMIHIDVKKVGTIPDGGGWRVHGRGSQVDRTRPQRRAGYTFLHTAIDGFSRLAYTEALPDEKAVTALGFLSRARVWFAAHGITRIVRVVTDNGGAYRSAAFTRALAATRTRHQRTRPYTPRHNGKVERYHRILAEELLYARPYDNEAERTRAIQVWNIHYNYHRPHTACRNQPPATRVHERVTNVMTSYT